MASKFKHLPDISTIQPERLIKYRVSEDRFAAEVLLPGLSYTDFDQKIGGRVTLWSLAKLCESVRSISFEKGFAYAPELLENPFSPRKLTFIVSNIFKFNPDVWNIRYYNTYGLKKPMHFITYVTDVGKTSYCMKSVWSNKNGKELGSFLSKAVIVDVQTRRPTALPDYFHTGLEKHFDEAEKANIEKNEFQSVPKNSFKCHFKAHHLDCDFNLHVNQGTYFKWCSDAASLGAHKGAFMNFKEQLELYCLSQVEVRFLDEVLLDEEVTVNVWTNETEQLSLYFAIVKQSSMISNMKMTFYNTTPNTDGLSQL